MVLWYLLTNLDPNKYKIYLFSVGNGELLKSLPKYIKYRVSYRNSGRLYEKAFRGFLKLIGVRPIAYQLKRIQKEIDADLWFVNTIIIPDAHMAARASEVPIVTYFHEVDNAFGFIKRKEFERILNTSHCCIGCSESVVEKLAVTGHKNIKIQNSFINDEIITVDREEVATLRNKLGIKQDDFVWVISGTATYMKGLDLVLPVIEHFKGKNVKIIWLGKSFDTGLDYYVKKVAGTRYPGQLIFPGALSTEYHQYLASGDGLLMLSREECFPLVMIEAAYLKLPIVSFNTGIVGTFVEDGMGKVVEGHNVNQLCKEMEWVQNNQHAIDFEKLRTKASIYTVKNQIKLFDSLLQEIIQEI